MKGLCATGNFFGPAGVDSFRKNNTICVDGHYL